MPMTPFHFGAGVLIKSFAPRSFSWAMFVLVNIAIDLEPIGGFLLNGDPAHRYLHTYLGATILALICGYWGRTWLERGLRWWNTKLSPSQAEWLAVTPQITAGSAIVSALIGTWSHVLLDSIMHPDVRPFWPMSDANEFRGLIPLEALHVLLLAFAFWGFLRLFTMQWHRVTAKRAVSKAGKFLRYLTGFVRTTLGLATVVWMVFLALQTSAQRQMARDAFDPLVWKNVEKTKRINNNPRIYMARDVIRLLEERRPSRTETEALLGSNADYADTEHLSYSLGTPDVPMHYFVLIVNFEKDGRFKSIRLRGGPD